MTDTDAEKCSIPLKDVSQVLKGIGASVKATDTGHRDLKRSQKVPTLSKENSLCFRLCDASGTEDIAVFKCADKSTLLWWLHGFQRRIFEQTKGFLRKQKQKSPRPPTATETEKKYQTLPRSMTVSGLRHKKTTVLGKDWLTVTKGAVQGRRKNMEDETLICLDLNKDLGLNVAEVGRLALLGVFDGHAGREAAEYLAEFLVQNLGEQVRLKEKDFSGALRETFLQTDREFREWAVANENISGSTALVVLFRNTEIIVANSGDCRAVLCRANKAVDLSVDHKPSRPDERNRIEEAGGWIDSQEVLNIPKLYALGLEHEELLDEHQELVGWVTVHKVCGALAMTRSVGDILIKDHLSENFEACYEEGFMAELILAEPEIKTDMIGESDEFLIVACDGLWDVFSSQEAVDYVHKMLDEGVPVEAVVERLIERALELGTLDNVSATITFFNL